MSTPSFEFADSPASVREKKAALVEVIELQRTYIERGYPGAAAVAAASPANASATPAKGPSSDEEDAEMRWYTDQASRLDKFKAALNAVRLQPDEFPLLVPESWAVRNEAAAASRELVPYTLRINARSQLTFVPIPPPGTDRRPQPDVADVSDATAASAGEAPSSSRDADLLQLRMQPSASDDVGSSLLVCGGLGAARVVFMDGVRQVRLATPAEGGDGGASTRRLSYDPDLTSAGSGGSGSGSSSAEASSSSHALPPPSAAGAAPRTLVIELFGEAPLCCVTPEAAELVEVIGAHLRRFNTSRVAQVRALKQLHALKATAYDTHDKTHVELLQRLWACAFGIDSKCQLHSERWIHLGFQSADPAKDFRGMGILGLANLVYFGEHYGDVFQRLVAAQRKRDYPLACAGINITSLLLELLHMRDDGDPASVQARPPFDREWSSDMCHFFCHMFYRERAFEDMYCFCLRLLDRMFVQMDADYADFNSVLAALRARLVEALAQRPLSFREFKRLIAAGATDSEGSVTSAGQLSAHGSISSGADGGGEGLDPEMLKRVIAEAMGRVDGLRKGAAAALSKVRLPGPAA